MRKKTILTITLLLAGTFTLFSAGIELTETAMREVGSFTVEAVTISGLKKTRETIIRPLIAIPEGTELASVDIGEIEQRLRRTSLFGDISFRYEVPSEGTVHLEVVLDERASLIGIPVIASNGESLLFGTTIFEANFLGLRRQLITAVFYTVDDGASVTLGYVDPTLADRNATLAVFTSGGNSNREDLLPDNTPFREYEANALRLTSSLQMRTQKRLQPRLRFKYEGVFVENGTTETAEMVGLGAALVWEDLVYLRFFEKGFRASADTNLGYNFRDQDDPWFTESTAHLAYAASLFGDHLVKLEARAGRSFTPTALQNQLPASGFRVIPSGDSVDREYLAGAFTYELPVLRLSWGTATAAAFFDGGTYDPDAATGMEVFYGPGGGIRLYLDKIVFPALQLSLGWNIPTETMQFGFSLGMNM
jgi:hypothetical protein